MIIIQRFLNFSTNRDYFYIFRKMIDHETRQKHTASFSFVILMVLIVLPVWWKTTEVYKASFPYSTVESLHTRPITQRADILLITAEEEDARVRYQTFSKVASKSVLFSVSLTSRILRGHEEEIIANAEDIAEIDEKVGSTLMQGLQGGMVFLEVPSTFFSDVPHIVLGNYRTVYFSTFVPSEDLAAVAVDSLLGEHKMLATIRTMTASSHSRPAPSDSASKRTTGHLDLFLSLLVPQPEFVMASWDITSATKQYLEPFLAGFPLNFSVSSQVVYLSPLNIPAASSSSGGVSLSPEQLGLSVNTVESLLASQSSSAPSLNMLVYIPPIENSPMSVTGSSSDSFLIPRWGGVNIYNYVSSEEQNISFPLNIDVDMRKVMGVWIGQIRSLLGVEHVKEYETLPLRSIGMRGWEMDYQLRYRYQIVQNKLIILIFVFLELLKISWTAGRP